MNVQCNLPYLSFFFSFLFVFHPPFFLPFCHPCPNSQSPVGIVHKKKESNNTSNNKKDNDFKPNLPYASIEKKTKRKKLNKS